MNKAQLQPFLIITGATGVGKSDLSLAFADWYTQQYGAVVIINGDLGQCYTPLTIGTAKPSWRAETYEHVLFDIVDEPVDISAYEYVQKVNSIMQQAWCNRQLPIIVGGSMFYLRSILYPLAPDFGSHNQHDQNNNKYTWEALCTIDPERAQLIHPHDTYRIQRALDQWYSTGVKPSLHKPLYNPPGKPFVLFCTRERTDLVARIQERTRQMLQSGFIQEGKGLDERWQKFVIVKGFIGYEEIFQYHDPQTLEELTEKIVIKTIQYAHRQEKFWRSWSAALARDCSLYDQINLTLSCLDLYLKQSFMDEFKCAIIPFLTHNVVVE
jgi:tRNA dimethylallyltransferase